MSLRNSSNNHNSRQKICHEKVVDTVLWGAEQEEGASNWYHQKPHDVNNRRATFQIKGANNQDRRGSIRSNQQKAEKRKSQKSYLPNYIQAVFTYMNGRGGANSMLKLEGFTQLKLENKYAEP